jgi:ABC-type nitrate/sulfonate/bicarbonate transport system ATPase subunit
MPIERQGATLTKIQVAHIGKAFDSDKGRLEVIDDLNFDVADSEFVAIVGPSGCGKTTLMNIIAGFLAPDSGGVHVDGVVRNGPNSKGIMITQQGSVFPWLTVRQNLLFGLPDVKPEILYMDEPFSALDALMSLRMQNELLRILAKERHTVMLITHDVEEAIHLADRILVLSPRPTRIKAEFKVPLAHPRKVSSPEAQALRVAILKELGVTESV